MSTQILDGKQLATILKEKIAAEVTSRNKKSLKKPGLAVVLIGNNPASAIYVNHKTKACEQVGFYSITKQLPSSTTEMQLLEVIHELNHNPDIHGILVQLPLPEHIDVQNIIEAIDPKKDVDGFHPYNLGRLAQGKPLLRPCTPFGVIHLLEHAAIHLTGLNAVIVGSSNIVGRPMALELLIKKCTVTVCHSKTKNLSHCIKDADLLVAAIGRPGVVNSEWIKPGAIVVDVGINRLENNKIVGDIDFQTASQKTSWITPVPGGVGPMTVATLLQNTLFAAKNFTE